MIDDSAVLFRGAKLGADGPPEDLLVQSGRFTSVGPPLEPLPAVRIVELAGRIVLPSLVESHIHLDKAFLDERRPNLSGTLEDAIAITQELKRSVTKEDILARSERALRLAIRHGTTWFRVHVEVDPIVGLKGMEATLEIRENFKDLANIQIVVFPQEGIEQQPGTLGLMREALRMGGDLVGGVPYNDVDAESHLDIVFGLAEEYGCGLDLHLDFSDDSRHRTIESVTRRTLSAGLQGRVAVGHVTSLGAMDDSTASRIIESIAEAGVTVVPLPATDLFLNGRGPVPPRFRGLSRVKDLIAGGANVAISSNNIRNAFTPSGNGNLLEIGLLLACTAHMSTVPDRALIPRLFTYNAAEALGIEDQYGIAEGRPADFAVFDTENFADLIIDQPEKRYVVKSGRIVVDNVRETRWPSG